MPAGGAAVAHQHWIVRRRLVGQASLASLQDGGGSDAGVDGHADVGQVAAPDISDVVLDRPPAPALHGGHVPIHRHDNQD